MLILALFCLIGLAAPKPAKLANTLELLHVVFRHGNRTPEHSYPNDPHLSQRYYPVGYGSLTLVGEKTAYKIGTSLRKAYNTFLNDIYTPEILEATSSAFPRCQASTLLLLAGLFPPKKQIQIWNRELKWQPIPYNYVPISVDKLFEPEVSCPKFKYFTKKHMKSSKYASTFSIFTNLTKYLKKQTGLEMNLINLALDIYSTLKSEHEWGLTLPSWTDNVWPEPITQMAALSWMEYFGNEELRKLGAGFLMSKIVNDTNLAISGKLVKGRKIYLYSGHDNNMVAILIWLGVFTPHNPRYGAHIIIEIHNLSPKRFIRIFYQNYNTSKPAPITIPNCGTLCPFDKFVKLYSKYLNPIHLCN